MNNETKQQIADDLRKYVAKFESQNKAAANLKNVSVATVSNILNKKWEKISDEIFTNIAKQVRKVRGEWKMVETANFLELNRIYSHASLYAQCFIVTGDPSVGKTATADHFKDNNKDAYVVKCDEFWNNKIFFKEILHAMGVDGAGATVSEMMGDIAKRAAFKTNPVLVLDEFDKVNDSILCSTISIFNRTEGKLGLVVQATDHLWRRIEKGLRLNKKGYKEFYSRFGSRVVKLEPNSETEILDILIANGVEDQDQAYTILNDSENDLRRVKKLIQIEQHSQI